MITIPAFFERNGLNYLLVSLRGTSAVYQVIGSARPRLEAITNQLPTRAGKSAKTGGGR